MKKWIALSAAVLISLTAIALTFMRHQDESPYQVPLETGDGWETASLQDVGMEEQPVNTLLRQLQEQNGQNINGLLVIKDGRIILETYNPGEDIAIEDGLSFTRTDFDRDTLHCQASVSKSITSILFGIAFDQGMISDLDEKLSVSFPEASGLKDGNKGQITLRHMLNMTPGFPWDESYAFTDDRNDLNRMYYSADPVKFVLDMPLAGSPGEAFIYNSGVTNVLGEILNRKTGIPMAEFAGKNLFAPLGITHYQWLTFPNDPKMVVASSLLYLRPRDMAKIGKLILQDGIWEGKQIVSKEWVRESTGESVSLKMDTSPVFSTTSYGYQWWRGQFSNGETKTIYAAGWGGQFIFIMPDIDLAVVLTGSNYAGNYLNVYDIINRYILGAVYGYPANEEPVLYGVTLTIPEDSDSNINLYQGPGYTYPVVGMLERGKQINIIGRNSRLELEQVWVQVSPDGWVALQDVPGWVIGNIVESRNLDPG